MACSAPSLLGGPSQPRHSLTQRLCPTSAALGAWRPTGWVGGSRPTWRLAEVTDSCATPKETAIPVPVPGLRRRKSHPRSGSRDPPPGQSTALLSSRPLVWTMGPSIVRDRASTPAVQLVGVAGSPLGRRMERCAAPNPALATTPERRHAPCTQGRSPGHVNTSQLGAAAQNSRRGREDASAGVDWSAIGQQLPAQAPRARRRPSSREPRHHAGRG